MKVVAKGETEVEKVTVKIPRNECVCEVCGVIQSIVGISEIKSSHMEVELFCEGCSSYEYPCFANPLSLEVS